MIFSRKFVQSLMKGKRLSNAIKRHHHLRERVGRHVSWRWNRFLSKSRRSQRTIRCRPMRPVYVSQTCDSRRNSSLAETSCQLCRPHVRTVLRRSAPTYVQLASALDPYPLSAPRPKSGRVAITRPAKTSSRLTQAQNHDTGHTTKKSSKAHRIEYRRVVFAILFIYRRLCL